MAKKSTKPETEAEAQAPAEAPKAKKADPKDPKRPVRITFNAAAPGLPYCKGDVITMPADWKFLQPLVNRNYVTAEGFYPQAETPIDPENVGSTEMNFGPTPAGIDAMLAALDADDE